MKPMTRAIALVLAASITLSGCVVVQEGGEGGTRPAPAGTSPLEDLLNVTVKGIFYVVTGIFTLVYWITVTAAFDDHYDSGPAYVCSTCGHRPCTCSGGSGHSSSHKHKDDKKKEDKRVAPLLKDKP